MALRRLVDGVFQCQKCGLMVFAERHSEDALICLDCGSTDLVVVDDDDDPAGEEDRDDKAEENEFDDEESDEETEEEE